MNTKNKFIAGIVLAGLLGLSMALILTGGYPPKSIIEGEIITQQGVDGKKVTLNKWEIVNKWAQQEDDGATHYYITYRADITKNSWSSYGGPLDQHRTLDDQESTLQYVKKGDVWYYVY